MKTLLRTLIIILLAFNANAQYTLVTNFSGTSTYGSTAVTVTSTGSVTTWVDVCLGPPTLYWAGPGAVGSYIFSFSSPVYSIHIDCDYANGGALGAGEYLEVFINGVFYSIKPADVSTYNLCGSGAGSSYLWTGFLMGPVPSLFDYNGGSFTINNCGGIKTIELKCDGSKGSGITWHIGFDPTFACTDVVSNNACFGDSIKIDMTGDSTSATYAWTGPGGFTSTLQNFYIYPATFADTGWYYVIKKIGVVNDTDSTHITVYPKPTAIAGNNSPLCAGLIDTLDLSVNLFAPGETYMWTGPNFFTSTLQNPTIPNFLPVNVGTYTVVSTTTFGCKDTGTTNVSLVPPPPGPVITGIPVYCYGVPFVPFSVTGLLTGAKLQWYTSATGGLPNPLPPAINTSIAGNTTVWVSQIIGSCESLRDSFMVTVNPQILPGFTWNTLLGCDADIVTFNNTSKHAQTYLWNFDEGPGSVDTIPPPHTFTGHTVHRVMLTASTPGCSDTIVGYVNTTHTVKADFTPMPDTFCAGQVQLTILDDTTLYADSSYATEPAAAGGSPSLANLTGTAGVTNTVVDKVLPAKYSWDFGDGTTDVVLNPPTHNYATGRVYHVTLMVTDSIGCQDTTSRDVHVLQYGIKITHDTMLCISQPLLLKNDRIDIPAGAYGLADYTYHWSPADHLDDTSVQMPYYTGFGVTTYTLMITENTYGCSVTDTMRINSVKGAAVTNVTATATINYGSSIQLNADNQVYYVWKPDDGSLSNPNINNPVATPAVTTLYTVYGYDVNGCVDSASVDVIVDSTMSEGLPSGFTPNGDGLNDVFRPVGLKFQKMVEFRIYNRWGTQVFYSNNVKNGWDGTFNGVPQDIDVYYYVIIVARPGGEGDNLVYKGEVTLIR